MLNTALQVSDSVQTISNFDIDLKRNYFIASFGCCFICDSLSGVSGLHNQRGVAKSGQSVLQTWDQEANML